MLVFTYVKCKEAFPFGEVPLFLRFWEKTEVCGLYKGGTHYG